MANLHLFTRDYYDDRSVSASYVGVFADLYAAFAAINRDWAEIMVVGEDGNLVRYAILEEHVQNDTGETRDVVKGWKVGDEFVPMHILNQKRVSYAPSNPFTPQATGTQLPAWQTVGGTGFVRPQNGDPLS